MAWIDPRADEYLRHRFTRADAYRLAPPGSPEAKMPGSIDPSATRVRLREAQEEEARARAAAEQEELERDTEALRESHQRVRIMLADVKFELALRALGRKFSENQLRVPAGNPDGGQWVTDAEEEGSSIATVAAPTDVSAARRRSGISEAECDAQYKQDKLICNLVRTPLCWAQAAERYAACLSGRPLPPLNF